MLGELGTSWPFLSLSLSSSSSPHFPPPPLPHPPSLLISSPSSLLIFPNLLLLFFPLLRSLSIISSPRIHLPPFINTRKIFMSIHFLSGCGSSFRATPAMGNGGPSLVPRPSGCPLPDSTEPRSPLPDIGHRSYSTVHGDAPWS